MRPSNYLMGSMQGYADLTLRRPLTAHSTSAYIAPCNLCMSSSALVPDMAPPPCGIAQLVDTRAHLPSESRYEGRRNAFWLGIRAGGTTSGMSARGWAGVRWYRVECWVMRKGHVTSNFLPSSSRLAVLSLSRLIFLISAFCARWHCYGCYMAMLPHVLHCSEHSE
ncbi:hypothetical protein OE88DRAFT_268839 [Heliocybe sulcata]|uniref:Uncharacterized protein n=1 Tax=Heliocybe sulcata TaxID=5364 RepID=A0A5C3N2B9_9AGAM|nr:hypothetical protein OE88DRAFT_268839 [Heliocybe sulcata]